MTPERELREALQELVDKLDRVAADTQPIFEFAAAHGMKYRGATWDLALSNARRVLAAPTPAPPTDEYNLRIYKIENRWYVDIDADRAHSGIANGATLSEAINCANEMLRHIRNTAIEEGRTPAEPAVLMQHSTKVELETSTVMQLSIERFNELVDSENKLHLEQSRKVRAYQVLRSLCGGKTRDFDTLEKLVDADEAHTLTSGIVIRISEQDKDWVVPLAHSHSKTLGDFMQLVFDKWIERTKKGEDLLAEPVLRAEDK